MQVFWAKDSQRPRLTVWDGHHTRHYEGCLEGEGAIHMAFRQDKLSLPTTTANLGRLYELDLETGEATLLNESAHGLF